MRAGRLPTLLGCAAVAVTTLGCTSLDRPRVQPDVVPMASPLQSLDVSLRGSTDALRVAVSGVGERLALTASPYRPSEPASLVEVPRAVLRADLADADDGFVVVYQASDAAAATTLAADLAAYLGSGLGQTNYPADTRFSVAVLDDTVIFTSFSSGRSSDPERAERVFDAVAGVGQPVEVAK
jgi:hypothetical protein